MIFNVDKIFAITLAGNSAFNGEEVLFCFVGVESNSFIGCFCVVGDDDAGETFM